MGSTKISSETTTTPTPTAEETALNQRNLRIALATEQPQQQAQLSGLELVNQMLGGSTNLPGYFGEIAQGISPQSQMSSGQLNPMAISSAAGALMRQYLPGYQQGNMLYSGVIQRDIQKRLTNELLLPVAQQNIANQQAAQQFNIGTEYSRQGYNQGNLLNLLNLALSGQAQVQQPVQANVSQLGSQLAGLRTTTTSGTQTSNPFQQSLYSSLGKTLGGGNITAGSGWFGI
jgi:hypothetical protein